MLKGLISLICLVIFLGGCSTHLPGNPDYNWLNGKWFGVRGGSGWTTELDLRVVDGDKVNLEVYLLSSGNTHTYTLLRKSNVLDGRSTTGNALLEKVS